MADANVLVLNNGSTSSKLALYTQCKGKLEEQPLWKAVLSKQAGEVQLRISARGKAHEDALSGDLDSCVRTALSMLWQGTSAVISDASKVTHVGHRVVHGGTEFSTATSITAGVFEQLKKLVELAPLHQPANIHGIETTSEFFPEAKQLAVFDTAYFHDLPMESAVYALPYELYEKHRIRRYGFHGISHKFCAGRAASLLSGSTSGRRILTCHLGGGASITASLNGRAVATTMGFTPLEGLVMATRSGSVDPGILLHLLEHKLYTPEELGKMLNSQSGLKGVSGVSGDVRELLKLADKGHERAQLALQIYTSSIAGHIGSLATALQGVDAIVFTAGVGENSAQIRKSVCDRLAFLGVQLDPSLNADCKQDMDVSAQGSTVKTLVIHTREEWAIAEECLL